MEKQKLSWYIEVELPEYGCVARELFVGETPEGTIRQVLAWFRGERLGRMRPLDFCPVWPEP